MGRCLCGDNSWIFRDKFCHGRYSDMTYSTADLGAFEVNVRIEVL